MDESVLAAVIALWEAKEDLSGLEQWLCKDLQASHNVTLEEFSDIFLGSLKSQAEELFRSNTSTCNTPQKPTLSRQGSLGSSRTQRESKEICEPEPGESSIQNDSDKIPDEDPFRDSYDIATLRDKSLHMADSSNLINKSMRRLFPKSVDNSLNQSNDFMMIHESSPGFAEKDASQRIENPQQQRCFKNSLFTSTPIRNGNELNPKSSGRRQPLNIALNQTFPLAHPTLSSGVERSVHSQNEIQSVGPRKQGNKTIAWGDLMDDNEDFPKLGHGPNSSNSQRRKVQSSANISGLSKDPKSTMVNPQTDKNIPTHPAKNKPKRRVAPISLGTATFRKTETTNIQDNTSNAFGNGFVNSSFRNTNNLLDAQGEEQDQCPNNEPINERRLLKEQKELIRNFQESATSNDQNPGNLRSAVMNLLSSTPNSAPIQGNETALNVFGSVQEFMGKVTFRKSIDVCVRIYSLIIDLNITMNILSELTFILSIINMDASQCVAPQPQRVRQLSVGEELARGPVNLVSAHCHSAIGFEVLFKSPLNYIYLAVEVLNKQRGKFLALLDTKTLRILIENEMLGVLSADLVTYLQDVYRVKNEIELRYGSEHEGFSSGGQSMLATQEGQQSVFYQVENDTRDNFPSQTEFVAFKKQRDLFYVILRMWEERHLYANFNFNQELGGRIRYLFVVMPHPINMAHLAKLFTSQLIMSCQNVGQSAAQAEILKRFNNVDPSKLSKLEQRFVQPGNYSAELQFPGIQVFFRDFIVAAEASPVFVEQLKIALMAELISRNDSTFDPLTVTTCTQNIEYNEVVVGPEAMSIMRVLAKFLGYLISLPFQYEANQNKIVDNKQVELRNIILPPFDVAAVLESAKNKDKLLITVPWMVEYLAMLDAVALQLSYYRKLIKSCYRLYMELPFQSRHSPMYCFILRLCLGWLFEKAHVSESLCVVNVNRSSANLCGKSVTDRQVIMLFHPVLEKVLPVACPFLADFRLNILNRKTSPRLVSRTTGSARRMHTTQLPDGMNKTTQMDEKRLRTTTETMPSSQSKLIETFLNSQSPSLRKVVDFLIERISSTVIKDFQIQHFLGVKKKAQSEAKQVNGNLSKKVVVNLLNGIYNAALTELTNEWTKTVPVSIDTKVKQSLESLLPVETIAAVRNVCRDIVIKMCTDKTNDWRISNLNNIEIFSKDIESEAAKIIKSKQNNVTESAETMTLSIDHKYPSAVYNNLHRVQQVISTDPDHFTKEMFSELIADLTTCYTYNKFTVSTLRHIVSTVNQLTLMIIARRWDLEIAFTSLLEFYNCECFMIPDKESQDDSQTSFILKVPSILPRILLCFFSSTTAAEISYRQLARYLALLINEELISFESLAKHFESLLELDWPPRKLQYLSSTLEWIWSSAMGSLSEKVNVVL